MDEKEKRQLLEDSIRADVEDLDDFPDDPQESLVCDSCQ